MLLISAPQILSTTILNIEEIPFGSPLCRSQEPQLVYDFMGFCMCIYIIYNYIYIYDYIVIYICYVAKGVLVRPRPAAVFFFFQPAAVPSDQIWLSQPVKRDSEGCLATDLKPYRRTRGWDGGSRELTAGPPLHPHILPVTEKDICYVAKGVLVRPRPAAVFFFFSTCSRAF